MVQKLPGNFQEKKEFKVSYLTENQEVNIPEVEEKEIDDEIFIKKALNMVANYYSENIISHCVIMPSGMFIPKK